MTAHRSAVVDTVEEIDAQWLTTVLRQAGVEATVKAVTPAPIGTGQMGSCFRLQIDYADGEGPTTLVAKLPPTDANSRAAGTLGYRCETGFYRDYAAQITARLPRCFLSDYDIETNGFTLLLEDLAPAQPGDQIAGCSIHQARAAALNVAGLHAPTWNDPRIREIDWLLPDLTAMPEFTDELLATATTQFLERHPVQDVTRTVLQRFSDDFTIWAGGRREPYALLHGDYRLDNLLFAEAAGAPDPVIAVDWQVMSLGLPLRDVTLLLATGLSVPDRRAGERGIVEAYHRRLLQLGVTDYDSESCWNDYRYALFHAPFIAMLGALVAQPTERGDRMFRIMAERAAAAIDDLDALSLLSTTSNNREGSQ